MSFLSDSTGLTETKLDDRREDDGHRVDSFAELVEKVAELSHANRDLVPLFRGQSKDYSTPRTNKTALYPSIFRSPPDDLHADELSRRFKRLSQAEEILGNIYFSRGISNARQVKIHQILRWSLLQHYEICPTPLLDVTHSLRVACSFAIYYQKKPAYLYVLGVPQISGGITSSWETGVQVVRLLSVCPPNARRPHYQEGYLVGEYPAMSLLNKFEYDRQEVDFARRLICKFKLSLEFLADARKKALVPMTLLLPDRRDEFIHVAKDVRTLLDE